MRSSIARVQGRGGACASGASSRSRLRSLAGASVSVLAALVAIDAAHAQDAAAPAASHTPSGAPASVGEVVVTGSRIAKKDFQANSPIVTVTSQSFEQNANIAVEATLNQLPEFTPDQSELGALQTGAIQPTAISTPGIATASLRGLGANRNLVLVDGRRLTPVNGLNVVDLNTIPTAMIDHVETITGGASAVYGADAMSGVVNFILKKNFQGVDVDTQYSATQHGGGEEFKASVLMGTNFADDKGNVTIGFEHYTRATIYEQSRQFYVNGEQDPTVGPNGLFQMTGAYYAPSAATGGCASNAAYVSDFGAAPTGASIFGGTAAGEEDGLCALGGAVAAGVYFNSNGSVYSVGDLGYGAWAYKDYTGTIDGTAVAYNTVENDFTGTSTTTLKSNTEQYYLLSPLSRWSMYSNGHYDFSDNLSLFGTGNFASTETFTKQLPTTPINGWGAIVPYDADVDSPVLADGSPNPDYLAPGTPGAQHPVPAALGLLLSNRSGPFPGSSAFSDYSEFDEDGAGVGTTAANTPWQLDDIPNPNDSWLPPRTTDVRNTNWQVTGGLDFSVPNTDWTGEIYGSHGQDVNYDLSTGNVDLDAWRDLITAPDWGEGYSVTGNQYPLIGGGFGAGTATCTSGLYNAIFYNEKPSQDCLNMLLVNLQSTTITTQDVVEFDTQGSLFRLPAGELKASLGADYRQNAMTFTPDTMQDINNITDQVSGLYPTQGFTGEVQAREGYGELDIPLLADLPFVKLLELNPGARFSTYTNSKPGWTYKLEGTWAVNDWVRFRGGYNLAVRAPSVAESDLALQEVYGGSSAWGDPCDTYTNAPYGANAAKNTNGAQGAANAKAICQAQMGGVGSQGATAYYNSLSPYGNNTFNTGALWVDQIGNPNLKPETAHTWTAGVVLRSPIANPWLSRTNLSIDWYKIKITNVIGFQSSDVINQECYDQDVTTLDTATGQYVTNSTALAAALASPACKASLRSTATGDYEITEVPYVNLGMLETSGYDVQLNWGVNFNAVGMSAIPGSVNVNILFNYLNHYLTNSGQPGAYTIDWAGTFGPSFGGVDPGAFRWKLNSSITYLVGPTSLTLDWRHLPSIQPASYYNADATVTNSPSGYKSTTNNVEPTSAYNIFDLSATYTFNKRYILRAGINNLFDVQPPTTDATYPTPPAGYTGSPYVASSGEGTTDELFYDVIGREFFVGLTAKF